MNNFEQLTIVVKNNDTESIYSNDITINVLNSNGECLAEAKVSEVTLNDFAKNWFYTDILEPEIDSFFYEDLNDEERAIAEVMPLEKLIEYITKKCGEEDTSTLNGLYKTYAALNNYYSKDILKRYTTCVRIKSINSYYENTGADTLIVDYLKENYELIFLNSTEECDEDWMDKANFKQIYKDYMCWTENKKLNEILC